MMYVIVASPNPTTVISAPLFPQLRPVNHHLRRAEVTAKLILAEKIVTLRREARDHIEADKEQVHRREWERILKEMDALEQVPLVSPCTAACVLQISWQSNTVSRRGQVLCP
jgi:hypothetical protein